MFLGLQVQQPTVGLLRGGGGGDTSILSPGHMCMAEITILNQPLKSSNDDQLMIIHKKFKLKAYSNQRKNLILKRWS
ncbi:hypothetical protein J6590_003178 [Homalodisca vitripennis]|nr:hypothetical protein J6590_003178 [Homalodisca vitripennis]